MSVRFLDFTDATQQESALVAALGQVLTQAIATRGQAGCVLPGGTSPRRWLPQLAQAPVDWPRVQLRLGDEREVPADHEDSNQRLIRQSLCDLLPQPPRLYPFPPVAAATSVITSCRASFPDFSHPADVVVLGMGEDGHTASLFPTAPQLPLALSTSIAGWLRMTPAGAAHARLSLTRAALLDSRQIFLVISGTAKKAVFERALQAGPMEELPVRAVLHQSSVPVTVFWNP